MRDSHWQDSWLFGLSFGHDSDIGLGVRLVKLGFISYRKEANQTGLSHIQDIGWRKNFKRLAVVVGAVDGWISLFSTSPNMMLSTIKVAIIKIDGKELHGQD